MKISKLFILLLSSILFIIPIQIANSCAWGYDEDELTLLPFRQEFINYPELYPFLYSYHYWKGGLTDWAENGGESETELFESKGVNVQNWVEYFGNKISDTDIESVIYNSGTEDILGIEDYLKGKGTLSDKWKNNELIDFWKNNYPSKSFQYLLFAMRVEPYVAQSDWWNETVRDMESLKEIAREAEKFAKSSKDPFLKLRYTYQAMRAAHYSKDYEKCLSLYDQFIGNTKKEESVIYYWCLSLRAGAYWRLNKFAEASYYNSIVFDRCLSRRLYSERDFWIDNETTWQQCLAMCKNDHEKNILWLLTGINQNNSAVPALQEMLKLDPGSKEIELLLAREVEKIQRTYMPGRWSFDYGGEMEELNSSWVESNDISEVYAIIQQAITINKMQTPAYWYNAAAFLLYLKKDFAGSEMYCKKAMENAVIQSAMWSQAKITSILNKIESLGTITKENEVIIQPDLEWLATNEGALYANKSDARRIVMYQLMKYYLAADKPVQAEMCRANAVEYYDIYEQPEKAPISELFNYFTNKNNSQFDKFLAAQYPYDADDMLEIKGTLLMREGRFKEAIGIFSGMKDTLHPNMTLPADPFVIHIYDCHDCDFVEYPGDYTKLSLCQKIVELEGKLKKDSENKTEIQHLLGNAYYNMSYWGNAWMALDYYRCHGCELSKVDPNDSYSWYYNDIYDLDKAKYYYQLAAEGSRGKEFAALNYFMLAKCEQNEYYRSDDFDYENANGLKENYRTNFSIIKNEYSETEFYQKAIGECKYFDYYVNRH
ncbi:MAG: hypothetical protein IPI31_02745 [Bacteroidetes bacterium]|jgi:hypothetical protein|nr:hypothetical protein [Bacteroidota bacterium]MBK7566721.1 hypothetical protein [Bacteroidota bacterium]